MDKQGWQIILAIKLIAILLGVIASALPPSSLEEATRTFTDLSRKGFLAASFFILGMGMVSLFSNLWNCYRHKGSWDHFYQPGPEHTLVAVYAVCLPSIYLAGSWVLLPAYTVTLLLIIFIIVSYMADEARKKNE